MSKRYIYVNGRRISISDDDDDGQFNGVGGSRYNTIDREHFGPREVIPAAHQQRIMHDVYNVHAPLLEANESSANRVLDDTAAPFHSANETTTCQLSKFALNASNQLSVASPEVVPTDDEVEGNVS